MDWQRQYAQAEQELRNGNSEKAISLAASAYRALEQDNPVLAWKFRLLQAQGLNRRTDRMQESLTLLAAAPSTLPQSLVSQIDITKTYPLCGLNRITEAESLLNKVNAIQGASDTLRAQLDYARGSCIAASDRSRAMAYFQSASVLSAGRDSYLQARALIYVGFLLMQDGRYDQAIERFNQALAQTDSPWLREIALGNIGYCHERLGDWRAAPDYLLQAEKISASVKDARADRALWLVDLGNHYFSQLQYAQAQEAYSKALTFAQEINDGSVKARCLNNLAVIALRTGDRAAAASYLQEAKLVKAPAEQQLYLQLSEARLLRIGGALESAEELMRKILANHPDTELRYHTETELATLYADEGRPREAERMFREGISTAEEAFARVVSDSFRISFMDQDPFYDAYVHFLVRQNRPLDALSIAERARSQALAAALGLDTGKTLNLKVIQSSLRSQTAVSLAYWLSPTESNLWVITPSQIKLLTLPPEMEIVKAVDAYGQEVLDLSRPEESGLGQKLYQMLVAPAEKYIPIGAKVIIVPHRRLYKLNFETLVSPHPKPHFWIDDVCIQNASFLAVLEKHGHVPPRYAKDLLLMGAPVEASKDFPGLAHAPEEVNRVSAHFARSKETVIDGAAATPAAYDLSKPSQFRFFHFVTHGTASDANPLDSAIILSPSSDGYKLYARDIIKTKIHPELVTISTCYGAGTRQYSGEGLVGLAWAFMRAGAHQVIGALWEVDDAANAELMGQFYAELMKGKTAPAALRDAKLAMLHSAGSRRRPYYWASLQIYTGP